MSAKAIAEFDAWYKLSSVYERQQECGNKVLDVFSSGRHLVIIVAPTQGGKTGVTLHVAHNLVTTGKVPAHNVFVITGMADNDWAEQMRDRFPRYMTKNIFHAANMHKQIERLTTLRDGLIILDETHIASQKDQRLDQLLKQAHFAGPEAFGARNVRLLMVSATPAHVLRDLQSFCKEEGNYTQVQLETDPEYRGMSEMVQDGQIRDCVPAFFSLKDEVERFDTPKAHLVRASPSMHQELYHQVKALEAEGSVTVVEYNSEQKHDLSIEELINQPYRTKHAIVLIKNRLRASKTIGCDAFQHIGVVVDVSPDASVTAQGLIGRMCGYDRPIYMPGFSPSIFGNMRAVKQYVEWYSSGDYDSVKYNSSTLTSNGQGRVDSARSLVATDVERPLKVRVVSQHPTHTAIANSYKDAQDKKSSIHVKYLGYDHNRETRDEDTFLRQFPRDDEGRIKIRLFDNEAAAAYTFFDVRKRIQQLRDNLVREDGKRVRVAVYPLYKSKDAWKRARHSYCLFYKVFHS